MSDTQLLELEISAEEVKKISDSEFHSMIDQLANQQKKGNLGFYLTVKYSQNLWFTGPPSEAFGDTPES